MKPYAKEFKPKKFGGGHCHNSNCFICSLNYNKDIRHIQARYIEARMVDDHGRALMKADLLKQVNDYYYEISIDDEDEVA